MFLKCIVFGILYYHFDVVQGHENDALNATKSKLIAKEHLFKDDVIEISIYAAVTESGQMKPPLMMISVMIDKTLGYKYEPYFPFLTEKVPLLDLNAAENNQSFIRSPSTVAFKIDFETNKLIALTPTLMVNLYPNKNNTGTGNSNERNETEQIIEVTSTNRDGKFYFDLNFTLRIDSTESEGSYTFRLHSYETAAIYVKVYLPLQIGSIFLKSIHCGIWFLILAWTVYHTFSTFLQENKGVVLVWFYLISKILTTICVKIDNISLFNIMCTSVETTVLLFYMIPRFVYYWTSKYNVYLKIDLVFHIFVGITMVHFVYKNYNNDFVMERAEAYLRFLLFLQSMAILLATTLRELRSGLLPEGFRKRFWRWRFVFAIYFLIESFDLVLLLMTSIGVPFYLYYVVVAIKDLLLLIFLMISYECFQYHEHITSNTVNVACAA